MNIDNIKVGEIYNNYPALCQALGEKSSSGNGKTTQLDKWSRFFKIRKIGRKLAIDEIYENPLPKATHGNTSPHINLSKLCLIKLLEDNDNHLIMSKSKMALALQYINEDFYKYYSNRETLSNITEIPRIQIDDFISTTSSAYKYSIDKIVDSMEKEGIINVEIKRYVEEHSIELKDDGSKAHRYIHREATPYEIDMYLNIQAKLFNHYGVANEQQIIAIGKKIEYDFKLEEKLKKFLDVERSYKCMDIRSTDVTIDRGYTLELGEDYHNKDIFKEFLKLWVADRLEKIDKGIQRAHSEYKDSDKRMVMSDTMESRRDIANKKNQHRLVKMLINNDVS